VTNDTGDTLKPLQKRTKKTRYIISIVVPIIAAVIGAIGGVVYNDIKECISPSRLSGEWVLIGNEIGENRNVHRIFEESLMLKSHGVNISGHGVQGDYKREYLGYDKNDYLVLAYQTPQKIGIGSILVRDRNGLGSLFVGQWTGRDCTVKKIVECPAILVRGNIGSANVEAAKRKYSEFLSLSCRETAEAACP